MKVVVVVVVVDNCTVKFSAAQKAVVISVETT